MLIAIVANGVNNVTHADLVKADVVIAVDNGASYCYLCDRTPDIVIGDLDSVSVHTLQQLQEDNVITQQYPQEKDYTDLQLAIQFALENYTDSYIHLYSVTGGRDDMTLSNILLLAHPEFANANIVLHGEQHKLQTITREKSFEYFLELATIVSLIPLSATVLLKSTRGLKYPLQDDILYFASTRSVSNEVVSETVTVEVNTGILLITYED